MKLKNQDNYKLCNQRRLDFYELKRTIHILKVLIIFIFIFSRILVKLAALTRTSLRLCSHFSDLYALLHISTYGRL